LNSGERMDIPETNFPAKRVAALVVLYHPDANVSDNIRSYCNDVEITFAIDNSDSINDEVVSAIQQLPSVQYIGNNGNKGIAHALNRGIKLAAEKGFDYVLTMDQDSKFPKANAATLIASLKNLPFTNIGIVAPLYSENVLRANSNNFNFTELKAVITSGNLLNIKAFQQAGDFDEKLFIDSVDHEYCLRLRKNGFTIQQYNKVYLDHSLGYQKKGPFLKIATTHHNATRRYYITRNRLYVSTKYFLLDPLFCAREFTFVFRDMVKILFFESDKRKKFLGFLMGIRDFLKGTYGERKSEISKR
jgi:rhamnosyltransferase